MKSVSFYKSTTILYFSLFLSMVLNYGYQIFMARNLNVVDFGTLNTMFSVLVIFSFFSKVIQNSVSKYIIESKPRNFSGIFVFF